MIRRPPRSTLDRSSAASDVYKRQFEFRAELGADGKPVMEPLCDADGLVMLDRDGQVMWLSLIHISEPTRPY